MAECLEWQTVLFPLVQDHSLANFPCLLQFPPLSSPQLTPFHLHSTSHSFSELSLPWAGGKGTVASKGARGEAALAWALPTPEAGRKNGADPIIATFLLPVPVGLLPAPPLPLHRCSFTGGRGVTAGREGSKEDENEPEMPWQGTRRNGRGAQRRKGKGKWKVRQRKVRAWVCMFAFCFR